MNSNENAGPTVEIGEANFDRGVRNATQPVLVEVLYRHETKYLPSTLAEAKAPARVQQRRSCELNGFGAHIQARRTLKLTASAKVPANLGRH